MTSNVAYLSAADLPETLPLFSLPGALLLPRGQMPLNIFEPRYLAMIDAALRSERLIGMIQPDPSPPTRSVSRRSTVLAVPAGSPARRNG